MNVPGPWLFVVGTLGTWRLWVLINRDTILDTWGLRDRAAPDGTWRRDLIDCPYCTGFWLSVATTGAWATVEGWPGIIGFGATWMAVSAAVSLLEHVADILTRFTPE